MCPALPIRVSGESLRERPSDWCVAASGSGSSGSGTGSHEPRQEREDAVPVNASQHALGYYLIPVARLNTLGTRASRKLTPYHRSLMFCFVLTHQYRFAYG